MWIARNKNNTLYLFKDKPFRMDREYDPDLDDRDYTGCWIGLYPDKPVELDSSLFPDLKWTDEPLEVEILPKKNKLLESIKQKTLAAALDYYDELAYDDLNDKETIEKLRYNLLLRLSDLESSRYDDFGVDLNFDDYDKS